MFILYAVLAGCVIGLRQRRLARAGSASCASRWAPLIAARHARPGRRCSRPRSATRSGPPRPAVYVASNVAVLVAVWRNLAIPGLPLVLVGGIANLVAIVANGGFMPVSPDALAAMGRVRAEGYSNSRLVDGVVLGPLTDLFAMPTWVPMANVFSIGDVLIGVGAAIAIVAAMHGRGPLEPRRRHAADAGGAPAH